MTKVVSARVLAARNARLVRGLALKKQWARSARGQHTPNEAVYNNAAAAIAQHRIDSHMLRVEQDIQFRNERDELKEPDSDDEELHEDWEGKVEAQKQQQLQQREHNQVAQWQKHHKQHTLLLRTSLAMLAVKVNLILKALYSQSASDLARASVYPVRQPRIIDILNSSSNSSSDNIDMAPMSGMTSLQNRCIVFMAFLGYPGYTTPAHTKPVFIKATFTAKDKVKDAIIIEVQDDGHLSMRDLSAGNTRHVYLIWPAPYSQTDPGEWAIAANWIERPEPNSWIQNNPVYTLKMFKVLKQFRVLRSNRV